MYFQAANSNHLHTSTSSSSFGFGKSNIMQVYASGLMAFRSPWVFSVEAFTRSARF